jgi:hypothetical protein
VAYVDNNVPWGAQVITIGATAFVAESVNVTEPSTVIEQRNQVGDPSGQVIIGGFVNGSAVLQLATSATGIPVAGATATISRNGSSVTIGIVLSEVGEVQAQLESRKVNVNFRRRYGT